MKKAKFMLAAIVLVAGVGGTLAFKSYKGHNISYFTCNTVGNANTCAAAASQFDNVTVTDKADATTTILSATTASVSGDACASHCDADLYLKGDF